MRGIVTCDRAYKKERNMNLKLNNEFRSSISPLEKRRIPQSIKEERRRTGRYIAILVGICLFLLAIYHAWVRRIPIVASLVVPALIMFVYVGWVLYTASRDKHKLLDAEAAREAAMEAEIEADIQNNLEIAIVPNRDNPKTASSEETGNTWAEISTALIREVSKEDHIPILVKPLILVNDMPTEDLDQKNTKVVDRVVYDKLKCVQPKQKFKRRFCRSKRNAVFKRSYSIA